jgi:hypothetical protein
MSLGGAERGFWRCDMTSTEDLIWLYNMAVEFNLEDEKMWLKQEIEERLAKPSVEENSQAEIIAA